jgi:UDP-perosamine 4-acetyltransferase
MKDVLIYGGGMLGRQLAHLLRAHFSETHRALGFVDDVREPRVQIAEGLCTVGTLDEVASAANLGPDQVHLVFGIGYSDMRARRRAFERARSAGYEFVTLVHPGALVEPSVQLGQGVTILAGSIVDQYVSIADACYLHIGTKMGENCTIGANNYFSAGSTLGGSVSVGTDNFFGINCTVVNDLTIGNHNFINAEALIYRPVGDHTRVVEYREQRNVAMPT